MSPQEVAKIRDLEKKIATDPKHANDILLLKQYVQGEAMEERLAAMHGLRRIFVAFIETGRLTVVKTNPGSASQKVQAQDKDNIAKEASLRDYKLWLQQQLQDFQSILCNFVQQGDSSIIAPAIRSLLELSKREWLILRGGLVRAKAGSSSSEDDSRHARFGIRTFNALLHALLTAKDIDVDVLLLLKDEVFCHADCAYYSWIHIRRALREAKHQLREDKVSKARTPAGAGGTAAAASQSSLVQNGLDLLRVMSLLDEEELSGPDAYLVDVRQTVRASKAVSGTGSGDEDDDDDVSGGDSDDEDEDSDFDESASEVDNEEEEEEEDKEEDLRKVVGKRAARSKGQAADDKSSSKRPRVAAGVSGIARAHDSKMHRKVFSAAWLALLALPFKPAQHKIALKHLPEHVMPYLTNPLLLADYLYSCYSSGGIVAILALQSLFSLIVKNNLDYPHFFESLYALCTVEVFSAKYRSRFLGLLHSALQSVNIPAYTAAAFIKRLMQLALLAPTPTAGYCIMQATWLMRQHTQCHRLIHASSGSGSGSGSSGSGSSAGPVYFATAPQSLEELHALESSLWEAQGLQQHYMHSVSTFGKALESALSTSTSRDAPALQVSEHLDHTYETLFDVELSQAKKGCPLAYSKPTGLFSSGEMLGTFFGSGQGR